MTFCNSRIARNGKVFIYRSPIEALRAYSPYSLWGGSKMSESPFIHKSSDRDVYVIGSEARRQASPF